jgi:hypothetical protein
MKLFDSVLVPVQETTMQDTSARYDDFVSQLDPHREDLTLIEAIESVKAAAKSKHTAMFDDSNLISTQIKENSATLMQLVGKGIKQRGNTKKGLCVNVRQHCFVFYYDMCTSVCMR